jgi:MarR-like DNA-binding transcriptional regulator SgrR of sgrS sRNA
MSIKDMRHYLKNMQRGADAATEQRQLFERHAVRLAEQICRLKTQQAYLVAKVDLWHAREEHDAAAEQAAIAVLMCKTRKLMRSLHA